MLRILDKNKVPVKGLRKYSDLCIENSIELDDKTLTFSVPYRNVRSAIVVEGYIETKEDRFVVKEIEKSSEGTANITAQLDLESLEGKPFRTFRSEEQTIKAALQLAFTGTGWTVGECSVSKKRTLSMANVSALDVLKQALKTYRAEIKIDSKKQSIDIYPEIGSDKGVYFSDQLNLRKLTVQYSTYDFYTEIEPYGKDGLTIETVNSGKIYLENHQYSSKKKRCIWKDERYTIADSLKEDAAAKLADMSKPYVSYSADITTAALAADSVTAEKIKVDDLYSLKASIAGFKISSDTISHQSITNPESGIGQNYYDTFFSSKDKRLTFRKGPGTSDYITFDIRGLRASGGKRLNLISDAETNDSSEGFSSGAHHSMGHTNIYGNLYVADSFRTVGTKQAVRQTENYGEKGVYCYETPTPHFGDIGSGEISEDGKCYIDIEDILKEMINTEMQYYVFLQKCGEGDLYVSECFPDYFIVTGTPGLRFFWELKAKQKGYEYNRYEGEDRVVGFRKIAYDEEYIAETEKLIEEREEI